jgi:AraC-like DNA-binding protein
MMSKIRHDPALVRSFGVTFLSPGTVKYPVQGWDQLIYATEGVVSVWTGSAQWVLPAHRALWVPDGVGHEVRIPGPASLRSVYLRARQARRMPRTCRAVNVPPLLRELILACVAAGAWSARKPAHRRAAAVLLDQLQTLPAEPLQLPPPRDERALRLAALLRHEPAIALPEAVRRSGASLRTFERLFRAETGLPLGAWHRRLRLQTALETLAQGESVAEVASACGYRGASAFVEMFRRELGVTPGRYFASTAARRL